jgi:hypothetical protein
MAHTHRYRDQTPEFAESALFGLIVQSLKCARAPARLRHYRNPDAKKRRLQPAALSQEPALDRAAVFGVAVVTCSWNERCGRGEPA